MSNEIESNIFILAGNGPYDNRGCEAIVRGTVKIIRKFFTAPYFVVISNFQNNSQYNEQSLGESDPSIVHLKSFVPMKRFDTPWWFQRAARLVGSARTGELAYFRMRRHVGRAKAVISIGGDNYSLDYGGPRSFTSLDDYVLERGKPMIIWGASVGPFEKKPAYERYIVKHLQKVSGIFARESITFDYLTSKGVVCNLYRVADPAFLLEAKMPQNSDFPDLDQAIGVNLSPLISSYLTSGNLEEWSQIARQIIIALRRTTKRSIYLVPHVTSPHSSDLAFLQRTRESIGLGDRDGVLLLSGKYSAAELKWIIGRMAAFVGSRTHSSIAALSGRVPTLSLVYSTKGRGINRDLFNDERFCLPPEQLKPEILSQKVATILHDSVQIRSRLEESIPHMEEMALSAGEYLRSIVSGDVNSQKTDT